MTSQRGPQVTTVEISKFKSNRLCRMSPYLISQDVELIRLPSAMPPLLCFHLNKAISPTYPHPINSTSSPHPHPLPTRLIYCDGCQTQDSGIKIRLDQVFWQHVMACLDSFWSWDSLRCVFRFASCSSNSAVYKSIVDVYLRITVSLLSLLGKRHIKSGKTFSAKQIKTGVLRKLQVPLVQKVPSVSEADLSNQNQQMLPCPKRSSVKPTNRLAVQPWV